MNFHFSPKKVTAKVIFQEAQKKKHSENAPFCPRALRPSHRQWNAFIIFFIFFLKNSLTFSLLAVRVLFEIMKKYIRKNYENFK